MYKILITGGAGYIGSMLTHKLVKEDYNVTVYDSLLYNQNILHFLSLPRNRFTFVKGDILDYDKLRPYIEECDIIIHLAALVGDPVCEYINKNIVNEINTVSVLEIINMSPLKVKHIFISSCSLYGYSESIVDEDSPVNPISVYAKSRYEVEKYINQFLENIIILRLGTVYGISYRPRFDTIFNKLVSQAVLNQKMSIFGGQQYRPFIHISDVVNAILLILTRGDFKKRLYNIAGLNSSISELALSIQDSLSDPTEIETNIEKIDQRDYRVSSKKFYNGHHSSYKASYFQGIVEIERAIKNKMVNPSKSKYSNIDYIKRHYCRNLRKTDVY